MFVFRCNSLRGAAIVCLASAALMAAGAPRQTSPSTWPRERLVALQVALDRHGFSPGEIDGRWGANTRRAIEAYTADDQANTVERLLSGAPGDGTTTYTITDDDAAGPFAARIPSDLEAQAELSALAYTSIGEAIAERFHCSEDLLRTLNPDAHFQAGERIVVPDVEPMAPAAPPFKQTIEDGTPAEAGDGTRAPAPAKGVEVTVSRSAGTLTVTRDARVIFHAPTTTGSVHDPLPLGDWKVTSIVRDPIFHYDPDLFWDADADAAKATIPPGPNGPVGVVWIDLSRPHYGIHGTPRPGAIGHTESHGCVRLTNWDARRVAALVAPGTPVHFVR